MADLKLKNGRPPAAATAAAAAAAAHRTSRVTPICRDCVYAGRAPRRRARGGVRGGSLHQPISGRSAAAHYTVVASSRHGVLKSISTPLSRRPLP